MEQSPRPICKQCAEKLNLKPMAGDFFLAEPCEDCGAFSGTQFTDLLIDKE